ncbi:hypothetical protein [Cetobacterium somerae]|uniref:Uncharacterized protein n=1 Tax=Cetobacterium somerae ATCC BAA-474 TaxID=1319815 RepID=U7V4A2_9FUSO|nr:hypothetical protein [Cetobacterium somerae]ERT65578.1 hypothetical protein HMPREF0202_02774 [Cetobacterium somerae ATCC BAA-474]
MNENKERLKNELILEQLEEIEKLIEEHEENLKYTKENILEALMKYSKSENIDEIIEKKELEELVASYKEVEP